MNEWLTNLLVAVILLCVWILAVLYYLSKMDRKNEEIKQACTERVIVICPLSSRQAKYLKQSADERSHRFVWSFSMHSIALYISQFSCW